MHRRDKNYVVRKTKNTQHVPRSYSCPSLEQKVRKREKKEGKREKVVEERHTNESRLSPFPLIIIHRHFS